MNRLLSSVETARVVGNPIGPVTPAAITTPHDQGRAVHVATPARSDQFRRPSYVGNSYLSRSRRSTTAGRQSMFRIS